MDDVTSLYTNKDRKQKLVEGLEKQYMLVMDASDSLDSKSWNILSVTSATLALVSSLQIVIADNVSDGFWVLLFFVLVFYFLLVREALNVIKPRKWPVVPSTDEGRLSRIGLLQKYVPIDEDTYWEKLLIDYAGAYNVDDPTEFLSGAIERAENNNKEKAQHIQNSIKYLSIIIVGLILMAIAARF